MGLGFISLGQGPLDPRTASGRVIFIGPSLLWISQYKLITSAWAKISELKHLYIYKNKFINVITRQLLILTC